MPRMDPVVAAGRALEEGRSAVIVTVTAVEGNPPSHPGMRLAVLDDQSTFGSLGCDGFDRSGAIDGKRAIQDGRRFKARYEWDDDSYITVDVKPFRPGEPFRVHPLDIPELLVVGTGPVARALVSLGDSMGFRVRVAAGPGPPSVGEFEDAEEVILTPDARAVEALRPGGQTYVVICGHDEEFSDPVLKALLASESPYLGMMGSTRHTGHLRDELLAAGFSEDVLSRVHSPVGLDIGAETPQEIALSALAEIVAVRRGRGGREG